MEPLLRNQKEGGGAGRSGNYKLDRRRIIIVQSVSSVFFLVVLLLLSAAVLVSQRPTTNNSYFPSVYAQQEHNNRQYDDAIINTGGLLGSGLLTHGNNPKHEDGRGTTNATNTSNLTSSSDLDSNQERGEKEGVSSIPTRIQRIKNWFICRSKVIRRFMTKVSQIVKDQPRKGWRRIKHVVLQRWRRRKQQEPGKSSISSSKSPPVDSSDTSSSSGAAAAAAAKKNESTVYLTTESNPPSTSPKPPTNDQQISSPRQSDVVSPPTETTTVLSVDESTDDAAAATLSTSTHHQQITGKEEGASHVESSASASASAAYAGIKSPTSTSASSSLNNSGAHQEEEKEEKDEDHESNRNGVIFRDVKVEDKNKDDKQDEQDDHRNKNNNNSDNIHEKETKEGITLDDVPSSSSSSSIEKSAATTTTTSTASAATNTTTNTTTSGSSSSTANPMKEESSSFTTVGTTSNKRSSNQGYHHYQQQQQQQLPQNKVRRMTCSRVCAGAIEKYYNPDLTMAPEMQCHCPAAPPKTSSFDWDTTYVKMLVQISDTERGEVILEVHDSWAPYASGRFLQLANTGFYAGNKFFKVEENFVAHFGINGDPTVSEAWGMRPLPEDPVKESNKRGYLSFAPDSRARLGTMTTTEVFINLVDNTHLDDEGFAPFARIVSGIQTIDALYSAYSSSTTSNPAATIAAPDPIKIYMQGNRYLEENYPKLSFIIGTRVERDLTPPPPASDS